MVQDSGGTRQGVVTATDNTLLKHDIHPLAANKRSIYGGVMLGDTDLMNPHQLEGLRRSVAMLPANTGSGILTREETLHLLDAMRAVLRDAPLDSGDG